MKNVCAMYGCKYVVSLTVAALMTTVLTMAVCIYIGS